MVAVSSRLVRRMNTGAANPAAPKNRVGSIPSRVAADAPMPRSSRISGRNGDIPVTADRSEMASRTMPATSSTRPRHND